MFGSDYEKSHDPMENPYIGPIDDDARFNTHSAMREEPFAQMVERVFDKNRYCEPGAKNPTHQIEFAKRVLNELNGEIVRHNEEFQHLDPWPTLMGLPPALVAMCILYPFGATQFDGKDGERVLALDIREDFFDRPHWITDERRIRSIVRQYNNMLTNDEVDEVIALLLDRAPVGKVATDPYLLPLENGVLDCRTMELHSYFKYDCAFMHVYPIAFPKAIIGGPDITLPNGDQLTFEDLSSMFLRRLFKMASPKGYVRYEDLFPNAAEDADGNGHGDVYPNPYVPTCSIQ